jgi:hypothetical protein
MKIRPVGAELFRAVKQSDGRTDMMKLIVAFRNFAKAHKTYLVFLTTQLYLDSFFGYTF